jgi:5-formyltetrahydrofolate cyclo-ligase
MASADPVSCYVSFQAEVETHTLIRRLLEEGRRVCVPWCDKDDLRLTRIESLEELKPRTIGLLEPGPELRQDATRTIDPNDVAVFLVPGLAFTREGDRIGYGRGYYDRMLATVVSGITAGLAFDAQIVDAMPITALDVRLDYVVTEERVYTARD